MQPKVVGVYANIVTREAVRAMIGQARERDIPIVVGGPDSPAHLDGSADYIVKGEGELTLTELMEKLRDGALPGDELDIAGLTYRKGGETVVGPAGRPWWAAVAVDWMPEPQMRVTVSAGTSMGKPAVSPTWRAP